MIQRPIPEPNSRPFFRAKLLGAVVAALLGVAVLATGSPASIQGIGDATPELVPFVGTFKITATWGTPSGGYHSYPAIDVKMPIGTPVYAAGAGTVASLKRDQSRCNPLDHSPDPTQEGVGVTWCINNGYAESGTRLVILHSDGRSSKYLHLSTIAAGIAQHTKVKAGQLIGASGNTGIADGPHLHYEEDAANGKAVDPGTWVACSAGEKVTYTDLIHRVNQPIANSGYACLGLATPAPATSPGFKGTWGGNEKQTNMSSTFWLTATFKTPEPRVGQVAILSSNCQGTVTLQRKEANGQHVFNVTWQRGGCLAGTIWLRPLSSTSLSYRWLSAGGGISSTATLRRLDSLRVTFLGPATSRYSADYWADVTGAKRTSGGTLAVSISATGRSDLRRPETSCLVGQATGTRLRPASVELSTNRAGRYIGDLIFSLPQPDTWLFNYSCRSDYTSVPVVRIG